MIFHFDFRMWARMLAVAWREENPAGRRAMLMPGAGLPFVGDEIQAIADQIAATVQRMRQSASDTRSSAGNLSVLLTLAVAVVPTAPVIAVYVPRRVRELRGRAGEKATRPAIVVPFRVDREAGH